MTLELNSNIILPVLQKCGSPAEHAFENNTAIIEPGDFLRFCQHIKNAPGIELDYLSSITAADFPDFFEITYLFYSLEHNHQLTLKMRCTDKSRPAVPSITPLYNGANFQEREIYDLFGITFTNHPKLERIFLWEDFTGHPLRKDYGIDS